MRRHRLALCLPILLAACSGADSDAAQGGLTADDAKSLDEAAAKLDAQMQPTAQEQAAPAQQQAHSDREN